MTPAETGRLLRKTREEKGLTVAQVQAELKIHERYLIAIENGNLDVMPGEVYRRGFLRSYAKFLGLDGAALLADVAAAPGESPAAEPPPRSPADPNRREPSLPPAADPLPDQAGQAKPKKSGPTVLIIVLLIILAVLAYYAPHLISGPRRPKGHAIVHHLGKPVRHPTAVSVVQVSNQQGTVTYRLSRGPIAVTATFSALCWVNVVSDGHNVTPTAGVELSSGSRTWTAQKNLQVRLGYAPGVRLKVDGQNLGAAGTDLVHTVRTFNFQVGG